MKLYGGFFCLCSRERNLEEQRRGGRKTQTAIASAESEPRSVWPADPSITLNISETSALTQPNKLAAVDSGSLRSPALSWSNLSDVPLRPLLRPRPPAGCPSPPDADNLTGVTGQRSQDTAGRPAGHHQGQSSGDWVLVCSEEGTLILLSSRCFHDWMNKQTDFVYMWQLIYPLMETVCIITSLIL